MRNVNTLSFEENLRYDSSGTDKLFTTRTISVESWVHCSELAAFGLTPTSDTKVTTLIKVLESVLLVPRKKLVYKIDKQTLLEADDKTDANNGPRPLTMRLVRVFGASAVKITFAVEVSKLDCSSSEPGDAYVTNNRWSTTESYDQSLTATRTIQGSLRLSKASNSPLAYRKIVIPPLSRGFRRQSISLTQSRTQLDLDYTITDVQAHAAPPWPATDWECTNAMVIPEGGLAQQHINVKLVGAPHVYRKHLAIAAVRTAEFLFGSFASVTDKGGRFLNIAIIDDLKNAAVTVQATIQQASSEEAAKWFAVLAGTHLDSEYRHIATRSKLDGYEHDKWPTPIDIDSPGPGAGFLQYLQDPCERGHTMSPGSSAPTYSPPEAIPGEPTEVKRYEGTEESRNKPPKDVTQSHVEAIYTHYTLDSEFRTNAHVIQLPLANTSLSGSSCEFIQFAQPVTTRVVRVVAERNGDWPAVPSIGQDDPRGPLLSWEVMPSAPTIDPLHGKIRLYRVEARYVFGYRNPPLVGDALPVGTLPWIQDVGISEFPTEAESNGLIF